MEKTDRIVWLDALKGIGMLLIMLVHMNCFSFNTQYLIAGYVAMFFVASGISFKIKTDISVGIEKKASRLLIPYAFYTMIIVFITYTMSLVNGKDIDLGRKVIVVLYSRYCLDPSNQTENLLLNGGNAPLWFMTSMFTAFLLVYLWQKLKQQNIVLVIYLLLSMGLTQVPILLPWSIDMAPLGALLIIAGFKSKAILCSSKYHLWFPVSLAVYVGIVYVNGQSNMSLRQYGNLGMISALLFIAIGILEFWIVAVVCRLIEGTKAANILAYVGRNSLRLMCIHMFVWVSFKDIILSKLGEQWHLPLIVVVLIIIFTVNHILNIICNRYNNRLSLLKYI